MPSLTFLFWNLNRKPLEHRVARVVAAHGVDVVCLAECATDPAQVAATIGPFVAAGGADNGLVVLARSPRVRSTHLSADRLNRWLMYQLVVARIETLVLVCAHLPSKLDADDATQRMASRRLADGLADVESRQGHRRTLVVGDLNMNPFEEGVAGADYLHGVMDREVARRERRRVQGQVRPMLYNPMWGMMGDRSPGPPGTYYRVAPAAVNYFWSTFDQVLLRPAVMDRLDDLRVLDSDGVESLLADGIPDAANASDHLPLLFRMTW